MADISKIGVKGETYGIKDEVARAVTDRMSADGNTLNVGYDTTNFGDAASVGYFGTNVTVYVDTEITNSRLYFNFVADGVEYNSVEWETIRGDYGAHISTKVYYYRKDGSREIAYDHNGAGWILPQEITATDKLAFREIYEETTGSGLPYQNYFTDYKELEGARINNTFLNDDTIAALKGLEEIGSFRITDIIAEYQNNVTFRNAVHKAMFMRIGGLGSAFYPVFVNYGSYAGVYVGWCDAADFSLTLPNHGVSTSPFDGKYAVTLYR
jgi:hypothetical protein